MEIRLEHITKVYEESDNNRPALADVSIRINSGEFYFLLGPSGCGKTTLLRVVAGLLEPTSGRIYFDEKDVTGLPAEKRKTAMVFQGYALWPHMTVRQNVEFGPRMQRVGRIERRRFAGEQLDRVQMGDFERRRPNQLSGGQQQRVALARALAAGSDCLLLDEPLSNLDARLRLRMRDELRRLVKSSGITAIYVTHDQKEALSMADRIAVMNNGMVVQVGSPEHLYNRPATRFVADFLGEANFIRGVLEETGPPAVIRTALGKILASEAEGIEEGTEVTCCVRPERIAIVADKEHGVRGDETLLPAKIVTNIYLGEIRQYTCVLEDEEETFWKISLLADSAEMLKHGTRVNLRISPRDISLLRD